MCGGEGGRESGLANAAAAVGSIEMSPWTLGLWTRRRCVQELHKLFRKMNQMCDTAGCHLESHRGHHRARVCVCLLTLLHIEDQFSNLAR